MLVKIIKFDGRHKLSNEWEENPFIVEGQPNPDIPVYIVKKENGEGRKRTLHSDDVDDDVETIGNNILTAANSSIPNKGVLMRPRDSVVS